MRRPPRPTQATDAYAVVTSRCGARKLAFGTTSRLERGQTPIPQTADQPLEPLAHAVDLRSRQAQLEHVPFAPHAPIRIEIGGPVDCDVLTVAPFELREHAERLGEVFGPERLQPCRCRSSNPFDTHRAPLRPAIARGTIERHAVVD